MAFGAAAANLLALGRTDARSVRVWCRTERSGPFPLRIRGAAGSFDRTVLLEVPDAPARDNTVCLSYPDDFPGEPALAPLTRYICDVRSAAGDVVVGEASFETAPATAADTPERFSIAFLSCHQPFHPGSGDLLDQRLALLKCLPEAYGRYNVKLQVMMGDQMYADAPGAFSLLNPAYAKDKGPSPDIRTWPVDDVRAAYQERHRIFWQPLAWRKLMSLCPSYSILDDHEVFDHWGTLPADEESRRQQIVRGARLAYMDYQGCRHEPWDGVDIRPALDYEFRYGTLAAFVFDLRSERSRAGGRILSQQQLDRFAAFLARNVDAQALLIVTSVPLVHIPDWVTWTGQTLWDDRVDFADLWSASHNHRDRAAVVNLLDQHLERPEASGQKLLIAGGDLHVGGAFIVRLVASGRPMFQLTSSGISNPIDDPTRRTLAALGPRLSNTFNRTSDGLLDVRLLPPRHEGPAQNPYTAANAGIVQFERIAGRTNLRLKLLGESQGRAVEVFESGLL